MIRVNPALCVLITGVALCTFQQEIRKPSAGVPKKESATETQLAANRHDKQQAAETEALNAIAAAITKDTKERADEAQQEATIKQENSKYERWLICVGIAQTIALILTLAAVWYQATRTKDAAVAAQKSADAAFLNAQAVINSERAWIDAELVEDNGSNIQYLLKVTNCGKTPAEVLSCDVGIDSFDSTKLDIIKHPPDPQRRFDPDKMPSGYTKVMSFFLAGGESHTESGIDVSKTFSDWNDIRTGKKTGQIHMRIKYYDVLAIKEPRPIRTTSFLCFYGISLPAVLNRLSLWNKYT